MNINPFLMLLALVAGFLYSWQFVVVRKVARDVPALAAGAVAATAAARVYFLIGRSFQCVRSPRATGRS